MGHLQQRTAVLARDLGVVLARFAVEERTWRRPVPPKEYNRSGKCTAASCDKSDSHSASARCHRSLKPRMLWCGPVFSYRRRIGSWESSGRKRPTSWQSTWQRRGKVEGHIPEVWSCFGALSGSQASVDREASRCWTKPVDEFLQASWSVRRFDLACGFGAGASAQAAGRESDWAW